MSINDCGMRKEREDCKADKTIRVINIGLRRFYDALGMQGVKSTHVEWSPPVKQSKEISDLLDQFL